MNSLPCVSDRERILRVIKRNPRVTILEIAQSLDIQRGSIAAHIKQFQREGLIRAIQLPARPTIDEIRNGYEFILPEPKPVVPYKPPVPKQWDPLAFLFGRATVEP